MGKRSIYLSEYHDILLSGGAIGISISSLVQRAIDEWWKQHWKEIPYLDYMEVVKDLAALKLANPLIVINHYQLRSSVDKWLKENPQ